MPVWMLFAPQLQQQRRHGREHRLRPVYLCVTGWAERNHEVKKGFARNAMVNDDRPLSSTRGAPHARQQ